MGGSWHRNQPVSCANWFRDNSNYIGFAKNWDNKMTYQCFCGWKAYGSEWKVADYWHTKVSGISVYCPRCNNHFPYLKIVENSRRGLTKPKKSGRLRK